jgi:hypothetical protein
MPSPASWIPFRWPPAWTDPALLALLEGTPFNCLALEWDPALAAVAAKAHSSGLSLVAIGNEASRAAAVAAGIASPDQSLLIASDAVWPGIASQEGGEPSGPTANPWIDSNAWLQRLANVKTPGKSRWLLFEPPHAPQIVLLEAYLRAIADTWTWGGRWVVSLDATLRDALAHRDANALASWHAIGAAVASFERRRDWNALEPLGVTGVVSDFAGPNETISREILNLMGRRSLAYRIIETSAVANVSLEGLHALVYVDEGAPAPSLRSKLLDFANRGGLLLVGAGWDKPSGMPSGIEHPRVDVRRLGKGRLAVSKAGSPDPFMIARDVHMLLGRTYDVARFFNLSAFVSLCSASLDGSKEVVQIVSFAIRFANDLATVWVPGKYASARLWSLDSPNPAALEMVAENGGTSLLLPPVPVYAGIEMTR